MNNFTRAPDYVAYLAYILSSLPQEEDRIRTIAGYLLKNNARLILRASPDVLTFAKSAVLVAFNDPSIMIRNAAAQDIVAFLGILEPRNWPECLQQLVHMLDAPNVDQQEVRSYFNASLCVAPNSRWSLRLNGHILRRMIHEPFGPHVCNIRYAGPLYRCTRWETLFASGNALDAW